jgi:hypothetical protein
MWSEIPRKWGNGQWTYESHTLESEVFGFFFTTTVHKTYILSTVQIERTATLDILLHRLLESKSLLKTEGFRSFSLEHNPHFYRRFPDQLADFQLSPSSEIPHIRAVSARDKVTEFEILHVIVDRKSMGPQITLRNQSKLILPGGCGNGWHLNDDDVSVATKIKGRRQVTLFHCLCSNFFSPRSLWEISCMGHKKTTRCSSISPLSHNPSW